MRRPFAALLMGALGLALPAEAKDGPGFTGVNATGSLWRTPSSLWRVPSRPAFHRPRFHRRPFVPALLDRGDTQVTVIVQQVFAPPPSPILLPSVLDLPVQMGIREAKPAQPAVYVLDERGEVSSRRRMSAGPKIVEIGPGEPAEPGFGAKIIHLAMPARGAH